MQVIVLTDVSLAKQLEINDWTHPNGIPFIAADTRGLFGYVLSCPCPLQASHTFQDRVQ